MVLKDKLGLVKMYAIMDASQYSHMVVGESLDRVLAQFTNGNITSDTLQEKTITIKKVAIIGSGEPVVYIVDTEERKKAVWSARGAFLEAIKASTTEMDECDVVVPVNKIDAFIKFTHQLSAEQCVTKRIFVNNRTAGCIYE